METGERTQETASHLPLIYLLFFFSGASSLIYQVLWLKQLSLLFGSTAQATATALAVFFLGLSVGGWFWGRRASRLTQPLRAYAWLELGIAASAVIYFFLLDFYYLLYSPLYGMFGGRLWLWTLVKFLLATGVLFPPAFFMGGTLPIIGQYMIPRAERLGRTGTMLYAINTAGACLGALAAGFYLPRVLGFTDSYMVAILINLLIGFTVFKLSRMPGALPEAPPLDAAPETTRLASGHPPLGRRGLFLVAFSSGFITLGLEVIWTRMFSQVFDNSVYSFAVILVMILLALAIGAAVAHQLCRLPHDPALVLFALLLAGGFTVGLTPTVLYYATDGFSQLPLAPNWILYHFTMIRLAALVILGPAILCGSVFPYLLKLAEETCDDVGATLGRIVAVNTVGGILGSLVTGFALMSLVGLWGAMRFMVLFYLLLPLLFYVRSRWEFFNYRTVAVCLILGFMAFLDPARYPLVKMEPNESLHEIWEGSHGVVAVVDSEDKGLRIKLNNHYRLGGSQGAPLEERQTQLALSLNPDARKIFFLGMGTGITAGAALGPKAERIVICELVPEVITASRKYFGRYTHHLMDDPRVKVIAEDGRNYLLGAHEKFDVIIGDLFVPWQAGTGNLYSLEHFTTVFDHLEEDGIYVQWLPMFQLSSEDFGTIANTMLQVFPQVTLWRADFSPRMPVLALVGQRKASPLDIGNILAYARQNHDLPKAEEPIIEATFLQNYAGNLSEFASVFEEYPVNTDDRPVIEYSAPQLLASQGNLEHTNFISTKLVAFYRFLSDGLPVDKDPYLVDLTATQRGYIKAGRIFFQMNVLRDLGQVQEAQPLLGQYLSLVPEMITHDVMRVFSQPQ